MVVVLWEGGQDRCNLGYTAPLTLVPMASLRPPVHPDYDSDESRCIRGAKGNCNPGYRGVVAAFFLR